MKYKGIDMRYKLKEAIEKRLKVTYGTRSEEFHLIDSSDIDYNTSFAISIDEFLSLSEEEAKERILSPMSWSSIK